MIGPVKRPSRLPGLNVLCRGLLRLEVAYKLLGKRAGLLFVEKPIGAHFATKEGNLPVRTDNPCTPKAVDLLNVNGIAIRSYESGAHGLVCCLV